MDGLVYVKVGDLFLVFVSGMLYDVVDDSDGNGVFDGFVDIDFFMLVNFSDNGVI